MPTHAKTPPSSVTKSDGTTGQRLAYPLGVGAVALTVFLLTLAPTVTAEDSGELVAAAWHFGIAHPPGYPLWTMLCGAFSHIVPLGSIAWRANLFSAICSAAAGVWAYAAIREARLQRPAAAAAALVWILSRWSWTQSVITEVYGLNSLLTAGVLWCGLRWFRTRTDRPLIVGSLLLGLGMSNHHVICLAALAVVVWILALQPDLLRRGKLILTSVCAFLIGLLPYLYLPFRAGADPPINWGNPSTFEAFWTHVTRSQYGTVGPMPAAAPRSLARLGPQLAQMTKAISDDLTPWLLGAAVAGMALMALGRGRGAAENRFRKRLLALVLLWVLSTGVLFVLLANFDLDRTSRWVMRVFFIPVSLGLMLPLATLLQWLTERLTHRLPRAGGTHKLVCAWAVALAGPLVQLTTHWRACDYSNYFYAYDHAENLLKCMLPEAMLFPSGDHNTFPLVYRVMVEGHRPDVLIADIAGYIRPELYADQHPEDRDDPQTWLIKRARRPVYYSTKERTPVGNARFVNAGMLYHLLPDGMQFDKTGLLDECRYRNISDPTVVDFGASHILADYWFFMGLDALEHDRAERALECFQTATAYGWGIKEVYNNVGSALGEHGLDDDAIGYMQQAARLDPSYTTPRWNLFRLSMSHTQWEKARQRLLEIFAVTPDDFRVHRELGFLLDRHLHDKQGSVRAWQESLRLNPAQPDVIGALKEHYDLIRAE